MNQIEIVNLESADGKTAESFKIRCNELARQGYKLSSSWCGVWGGEDGYTEQWMAVFVLPSALPQAVDAGRVYGGTE